MTKTQKIIKAAGGSRAVAAEFGVDPGTVWRWGKEDKFPAEKVKQLCKMTSGLITPAQVRPDIFGDD